MDFEYIINGYLECDKGFVTVGRDMGQKVKIPVQCFLVKHPKGNVLIDTGLDKNLDEVWGRRMKFFKPSIKTELLEYLKDIKIDFIINTHLHLDHAGNNPHFSDAEIIVQKAELKFALNPPAYQKYAYGKIEENLNYRFIDSDLDLFDDGTVKIIRTPGHTPGHQSVLLNLGEKKIFIAGDACYSAENLKYNCLSGIIWSPDKTMENYEMMRNLKDTIIVFGHEECKELL